MNITTKDQPIEYYDISDLDATGARWRAVYSDRSNGKTYQVLSKAVDNFFLYGKQIAVIRRNVEEIKRFRLMEYWTPQYEKITTYAKKNKVKYGNFDRYVIEPKLHYFYLVGINDAYENEQGKFVKEEHVELEIIGYFFCLKQWQYDKGAGYPNVTIIFYDEAITYSANELPDELTTFENIISTIVRLRTDFTVYLAGNVVNQNSKILYNMGIDTRKIKQGEIRKFAYYPESGGVNTVAVEFCKGINRPEENRAAFYFGHQRELSIVGNQWETDQYETFKPEDVQDLQLAVIIDIKPVRLYLYFTNETLFVSNTRTVRRCTYSVITDGATRPKQRTVSIKSSYCDPIKDLIIHYWQNGFCKFTDNMTGEDFRHILEYF